MESRASVLVTVVSVLATTWLAAAAPVTFAESTAIEPERRPNVVLVLVDDARTDDMVTLPKLRRLVGRAGATFTNTVSSFPLCCPARASLLTGQYPHNHHVLGNTAPLGGWTAFDDADTLATWLDPSYHTALIGKYFNQYNLPYVPPGWDTWMIPRSVYDYESTRWSINGVNQTIPGYQTDSMGRLAADFITRRAGATKPFFLHTSLVAPHAGNPAEPDDPPFPTPNVKDSYTDAFAGRASTDPSFNEQRIDDKPIRPPLLTDKEIAGLTEVNAQRRESLLSAQDSLVDIVRALKASEQLDDTYLFFISDNGYLIGEHRIRGGKVAPYEVSVKVPMLVRGPGITPGTMVRQPAGLQDFTPTVLGIAGLLKQPRPFPLDGVNLLPSIADATRLAERPLVIEAGPSSDKETEYRYHGIIAPLDGTTWKYVERSNGKNELYDLTGDPYELSNVSGRDRYRGVKTEMGELVQRYQWCAGHSCR